MKKLLLITVMIFTVTLSFSQVVKLKTFQSKVGSDPWRNVSILVTMDLDKNKIHIYAQAESDLDVLTTLEKDVVSDGTEWYFDCVDGDGIRCIVMYKKYNDTTNEHIATLQLTYSNTSIYYRLKKD